MNSSRALQLILPTDKRNPSFTLYEDDTEQRIHVYYGLELLQVVPADRQHVQYKLLVANLYNAGLRVASLESLFEVDRKTMRVWGLALRSGSVERLARALEGRQRQHKLTPEIRSFIRHRFAEVYRLHRRKYNTQLRREVSAVFGVELSGEAIRLLVRDLRAAAQEPPASSCAEAQGGVVSALGTGSEGVIPLAGEEVPAASPGASLVEKPCELAGIGAGLTVADPKLIPPTPAACAPEREATAAPAGSEGGVATPEVKVVEKPCELAVELPISPPSAPTPPKFTPPIQPWVPGQARWCDHLGVLLFWEALSQMATLLTLPVAWLKQWLASVLLGAHNVEQTKYLNWEELSLLLGQVVAAPTLQRNALSQLATQATVQAVWRWNARQVGALTESDFYLDPHTKHYTGQQPILKGWCPVIRWADKALHSDFVHTQRGEAIYCECTDNFADLRQRVWDLVVHLRQTLEWSSEKVITLVVDRGIFGLEVFEKVLATAGLHLITWEKGYQPGQWQEQLKEGEFVIERARNRAQDLRTYHFKYLERPWAKASGMRQLIVVATNPEGKSLELGVLTDDPTRPAREALRLIFNRWLQENDFKYEDKHFGINEITSYRTVPYEKLKGQLQDRQVKSGQAKALSQARLDLERQQKRHLFEQEQADVQHARRQARLAELEPPAADSADQPPKEGAKELARLRAANQRYEATRAERRKKIQALQEQMETNRQQWATIGKEESRLEQLIAAGMHRLDTGNKQLMDAIKIAASNTFRQALKPFKKAYDNYRDDHDYFRQLTHSGGVLRWTGEVFEVHFLPRVNYPPALQKIIVALLEQLNTRQPQLPDGSHRPLRFYLSDREDFEIRLKGSH
jgi:hypothetical protein